MIVLIIDTETTGLMPSRLMHLDRQPYVIQFCGMTVDLDTASIRDSFDTLIRPPRRDLLTDSVSSITRLTWDDLELAPPFSKVADRIFSMIADVPAVAAHNLSFDKSVIDVEARRLSRVVEWPERMICSIEQSVYVRGYRMDLSSFHESLFGEKFADAHRADVDAAALMRCLVEMRRRDMI